MIYTIPIDSNFDDTLKNFEKQLNEGEEITETNVVNGRFIIITKMKESNQKTRNLLLEEIRGRKKSKV